MSAIKSQHTRVFDQLMHEHREKLIEGLIAGTPEDHLAYRQLVGRLQGLAEALAISEQADFNISGDEPNAGAERIKD